jgi:hypothetical protein
MKTSFTKAELERIESATTMTLSERQAFYQAAGFLAPVEASPSPTIKLTNGIVRLHPVYGVAPALALGVSEVDPPLYVHAHVAAKACKMSASTVVNWADLLVDPQNPSVYRGQIPKSTADALVAAGVLTSSRNQNYTFVRFDAVLRVALASQAYAVPQPIPSLLPPPPAVQGSLPSISDLIPAQPVASAVEKDESEVTITAQRVVRLANALKQAERLHRLALIKSGRAQDVLRGSTVSEASTDYIVLKDEKGYEFRFRVADAQTIVRPDR